MAARKIDFNMGTSLPEKHMVTDIEDKKDGDSLCENRSKVRIQGDKEEIFRREKVHLQNSDKFPEDENLFVKNDFFVGDGITKNLNNSVFYEGKRLVGVNNKIMKYRRENTKLGYFSPIFSENRKSIRYDNKNFIENNAQKRSTKDFDTDNLKKTDKNSTCKDRIYDEEKCKDKCYNHYMEICKNDDKMRSKIRVYIEPEYKNFNDAKNSLKENSSNDMESIKFIEVQQENGKPFPDSFPGKEDRSTLNVVDYNLIDSNSKDFCQKSSESKSFNHFDKNFNIKDTKSNVENTRDKKKIRLESDDCLSNSRINVKKELNNSKCVEKSKSCFNFNESANKTEAKILTRDLFIENRSFCKYLDDSGDNHFTTNDLLIRKDQENKQIKTYLDIDDRNSSNEKYLEENSFLGKRQRMVLTLPQREYLKKIFQNLPFPNRSKLENLSYRLKISPRNVQIWFQNQRQKIKKKLKKSGEYRGEFVFYGSTKLKPIRGLDLLADAAEIVSRAEKEENRSKSEDLSARNSILISNFVDEKNDD